MNRLRLRYIVQCSFFCIGNIALAFISGIFALRIFDIIYMYEISFIYLKWNWRKCIAARPYYRRSLLHRNLPYQSCHLTPICKSFCASKEPQFDVLGMSCIDMVEFYRLLHLLLSGAVRLQASKKILESMDWRELHRNWQAQQLHYRLQRCFRPFDLDFTSTSYMESSNHCKKKDRPLSSLSYWYLVSWIRHLYLVAE